MSETANRAAGAIQIQDSGRVSESSVSYATRASTDNTNQAMSQATSGRTDQRAGRSRSRRRATIAQRSVQTPAPLAPAKPMTSRCSPYGPFC